MPVDVEFYQGERVEDLWDEVMPLLQSHWDEVGYFQDIPFDPNYEYYVNMEAAGVLRNYTVRKGGELIGYCVFIVMPHPHHQGSLQAATDIVYLDPAHRGRWIAERLLRWCNDQLREEGVEIVFYGVKVARDFGPILDRMGFPCIEHTHAGRL